MRIHANMQRFFRDVNPVHVMTTNRSYRESSIKRVIVEKQMYFEQYVRIVEQENTEIHFMIQFRIFQN